MKDKLLIALLSVLVLVVGALAIVNSNVPTADEIASKVKVQVPAVNLSGLATKDDVSALNSTISGLDEFEAEADEKTQNDTAKALVIQEIAKRDFKKALVKVLNDNAIENQSVEDYKHLTIEFEIKKVELSGKNAEVSVTLWVDGYNNDDKKESFESRIKATFDVEVDVDEIEEAEVEDYTLVVNHFY